DLIDDRTVGAKQRDAAVIGNASGVGLVSGDSATIRPGQGVAVCEQQITTGWNRERVDRDARERVADAAAGVDIVGRANQPAANVNRAVSGVEQLDEFVVRAARADEPD